MRRLSVMTMLDLAFKNDMKGYANITVLMRQS